MPQLKGSRTEANLMAIRAARNHARKYKGIQNGEIIIPRSAHFSFKKAADMMNLKIVEADLDDNFKIDVTEHTIENVNLPKNFGGFKIVHLSDLHNTEFGKDNEKLLKIIKEQKPDIIVITGDITQIDLPDGKKSGLMEAQKILKDIEGIAFCQFTEKDVVRHPLVQKIVKAYDDYESRQAKFKERRNQGVKENDKKKNRG